MNKKNLLLFVGLISALSTFAFSPYENYLQTENTTHAMLLATAKAGQVEKLQTALEALGEKKPAKAFHKVGISNVFSYSKKLQGKTWFLVHFDYTGENYHEAVNAFESTAAVKALAPLVEPHPRAKSYGNQWLQTEWMAFIRASQKTGKPTDRFAMVTRVKPEKEQEYRTLHQTIWPGVVDQMARGNYRNFSIFFVEIGDELYEFFHAEYVGDDLKKDTAMNLADPFNQRWWKLTDACQDPLPDAKGGIWSPMDKILPKETKK